MMRWLVDERWPFRERRILTVGVAALLLALASLLRPGIGLAIERAAPIPLPILETLVLEGSDPSHAVIMRLSCRETEQGRKRITCEFPAVELSQDSSRPSSQEDVRKGLFENADGLAVRWDSFRNGTPDQICGPDWRKDLAATEKAPWFHRLDDHTRTIVRETFLACEAPESANARWRSAVPSLEAYIDLEATIEAAKNLVLNETCRIEPLGQASAFLSEVAPNRWRSRIQLPSRSRCEITETITLGFAPDTREWTVTFASEIRRGASGNCKPSKRNASYRSSTENHRLTHPCRYINTNFRERP